MNSSDIEAEFDPFENDPVKKKAKDSSGRSGAGIAWLALLLGLAAIAYNAYQWWQGQGADTEARTRQVAINELRQTQAGLNDSINSLQNRLRLAEQKDDTGQFSAIRSDISALQSRLSDLGLSSADERVIVEALQVITTDLGQRVADIESSVAALSVRSESPGVSMDLAEVDYLLRLASERLILFGDARSAGRALGLADTHLEALEDPLYLPVRRRISEARQVLQDIPAPDLVATTARIASLQAAIPQLPFPGEVIVVEEAESADADAGWWQRLKNALKPLVKVRRRVNEDLELSLEDKDYLRQGLWLQLESARLAIMRNDATAWDQSLQLAEISMRSRFAVESKSIAQALAGIEELRAIELARETPDISAPWRQLRLLREGRPADIELPAPMVSEEPPQETAEASETEAAETEIADTEIADAEAEEMDAAENEPPAEPEDEEGSGG